jgi:multimeric flavodoxin WrbA
VDAILISGSRNPNGQTGRAMGAVAAGLKAGGAETRPFFLPTLDVQRCRQCNDDGWGLCRSEGRCVIEDDFARLVEAIRSAGAVVFATPVYFSDLSESLRAFLDRLRRITRHEAGQAEVTGTAALGVCVAGGGGGGAPACAENLQKILSRCGFDVVDTIAVRRQNLDVKLPVLEAAGRWLAGGPSS